MNPKVFLTFFILLLVFLFSAVVSAQDSYRIGVEYVKTVRLPEGESLTLKPVIFEQPVMLRVWRNRGEINDWKIAWIGLDSGRHDLKRWLDGADSLSVDLNVDVCAVLTDTCGILAEIRTPWTSRYPLPLYTTLMILAVVIWVLALPILWFIRRRLYPPSVVEVAVPEPLPTTMEKLEVFLKKYERDGTLDIDDESAFFTLLLLRWKECRGIDINDPRAICAAIAKDEQFGAVYGMVERWLFAPGKTSIDVDAVRKACAEPEPAAVLP